LKQLTKKGYPITELYQNEVMNLSTNMMNKKEIEEMMYSLFIHDEDVLFSKNLSCNCGTNHNSPTTYISFNLG